MQTKTHRKGAGEPALSANDWRAASDRHSKWIHQRARRFARQLPPHVASSLYEDLVAVGFRGFVEAMTKLDPEREESRDAYVRQVITGAMLDELRRLDPLSRDQRKRCRVLKRAEQDLTAKLRRPPTEDELSAASHLPLEEYRVAAAEANPTTVSLDAPAKNSGECIGAQIPDARVSDPFEAVLQKEQSGIVARAMRRLPETHRRVLTKYYIEGSTLQSISSGMNVCAARVSQIRSEGVSRLRREIGLLRAS